MGGSQSTAKVSESMADFGARWNSRDVKESQTELFWKIVSDDPEDFTEKFKEAQLNYVFTDESEKLRTNLVGGGDDPYNTLQMWRQAVKGNTAIPIMDVSFPGKGCYRVMHPLGVPGVHLGDNHLSKASHLIVIKASREGVVTFNDFLPTTKEETDDFEFRQGLLDMAFAKMKANVPLSECGEAVVKKAEELGVDKNVGIRDFLVRMIDAVPDKGGTPGYTLADGSNEDVSGDTASVKALVEAVYTQPGLKVKKLIQPNNHVSVMISHIHGFLLNEVPECMKATYVECEDILKVKRDYETMVSQEGAQQLALDVSEEEDNSLSRQASTVRCS